METFMCTLCGVAVSDKFGEAWLKEFRVIYAQPPSWDDVKLSGVCSAGESDENDPRNMGLIVARCPRDASKRYDDEDLGPNSKVMVKLGPVAPNPHQLYPPGVTKCGFAFHAACWDLLAEIVHMDISILFGICFSMPIVNNAIQWGHLYLGAASFRSYSTWCFGFMPQELTSHPKSSLFRSDPMNIPDLQYLMQCAAGFELPAYPWSSVQATNDLFDRLPVEILQSILTSLCSRDVASLRSASRVVARLNLPEPFWASRFQAGYEYAHIFETSLGRPRSWKALYMFMRILQRQSPALQNRARVWSLGLRIKELYDQLERVPCQGISLASKFEPDGIRDDREWFAASDGLLDNSSDKWYHLQEGCRGLRIREIQLPAPSELFHLVVSFTVVNKREFVSGLQFMTREGGCKCLGYITPYQRAITLPEAACVSGWHLALSDGGIKAIALELDDRNLSPWAGEPMSFPRWRLSTPAGASNDSLLGQRMPFRNRPYWPSIYPPHGEDHASTVAVDGPGGERITEIRINETLDGPIKMETLKLGYFGLLSSDVGAGQDESAVGRPTDQDGDQH
ncbi:unnamed protein product [Clonostachys rosea]|uniref:F-box domain-containing protein n=1 Tax=Bionectria ochroleuca TaxID=29856 RepID=A0ABY6UY37_BIOOC|nr:unnamed protein product [Clonostachys rosea]